MQFTESFDQRSPQRLVVTLVGATSHMILASRSARSVTLPSCSPILKPIWLRSVRMAWPGSYMPAPMVMTQPSHRSRPGHRGHPLVVDAVLEVDDDAVGLLQVRQRRGPPPTPCRRTSRRRRRRRTARPPTAARGSWSAFTGIRCSPQVPESRSPTLFIASTWSGHWSISVTSCPAFVSMPAHHAADRPDPDDADSIAHRFPVSSLAYLKGVSWTGAPAGVYAVGAALVRAVATTCAGTTSDCSTCGYVRAS